MTAEQIISKLAKAEHEPSETCLDIAVFDMKAREAELVNDEGFDVQVEYLIDAGYHAGSILKLLGLA